VTPRSTGEASGSVATSVLRRHGLIVAGMCRNIRCLHNFEPATTDDEVREAAL